MESEIDDVMETLKEAGLPFDYDKADLHINEKFGRLTIYIHDLKSETCIEIIKNLHDEEKSGNKLSVFSLVEDTPTKNLGKELEELIGANETAANDTFNTSLSVAPLDPPNNTDFFNDFLNPHMEPSKSKLWADQIDDLNISDDSDDEMKALRESFKKTEKRKAGESPDKDEFEKMLSKKEKKKLKQSLNKSN